MYHVGVVFHDDRNNVDSWAARRMARGIQRESIINVVLVRAICFDHR